MRARTIRVVFAAKLLKKSVLHAQSFPSIKAFLALKLSLVPVPAQRRFALARVCVPDLDCLVIASTCYSCAVWAPGDGHDPAFAMR